MQAFEAIGNAVEHLWRNANYNDEVFPDIAQQVLRDTTPVDRISP